MKRAVLLGWLGLGLASCVNRGPDRLSACLSDSTFMPRYLASADPNRVMVGGIGRDGQAACFWSEGDKVLSVTLTSGAWKACKAQATDCTVLASGSKVLLNDRDYELAGSRSLSAAPPDQVAHAVWYLIGQFAEGFAIGLGGGMGAAIGHDLIAGTAAGSAALAPRANFSGPPIEATYHNPQSYCTPTGGAINGYPSYVCR